VSAWVRIALLPRVSWSSSLHLQVIVFFKSLSYKHSTYFIKQRYQKKKPAPKAEVINLDPVFQVLRSELGPNWELYKEFLFGAQAAIGRRENTSAWG
jgi:hypothetical protein